MKITKYPQSCLLAESRGNKLLFDPGVLEYEERFLEEWQGCDAVFITHKHADHCHAEVIAEFDPSVKIYTTAEVIQAHSALSRAERIAEGDEVTVGCFTVTAVKAVHGYHPRMRGNEVRENVGFLVSDAERTLYITSDTICFPTDIRADAIAMPVTGHGVTMTAFEASLFAEETGAEHILLTHMDNPAFETDFAYIDKHFDNAGLTYTVLAAGGAMEI